MIDPLKMDAVLRRGPAVATIVSEWRVVDEQRRKLQAELDGLRQEANLANERMGPLAKEIGAARRYYRPKEAALLARRHGVYLIGRIVCFEDPVLSSALPERSAMTTPRPRLLGVGLYTRADAVRLLKMTPSRVGRWVKGCSYRLSYTPDRERRDQPPVVRVRLPRIGGTTLISFLDLMELRVVKALVDQGISLQHVRRVAKIASEVFRTPYPFASRRIYTDGVEVFASLARDAGIADLIELSARHAQIIAGQVVAPYLVELDFDPRSQLAERWWPLGKSVPVVLDPKVAFGAPVVAGTATRTDVVAALAEAVDAAAAADAYRIGRVEVEAAARFESELAAAA